jgi:hypothetical protein
MPSLCTPEGENSLPIYCTFLSLICLVAACIFHVRFPLLIPHLNLNRDMFMGLSRADTTQ